MMFDDMTQNDAPMTDAQSTDDAAMPASEELETQAPAEEAAPEAPAEESAPEAPAAE